MRPIWEENIQTLRILEWLSTHLLESLRVVYTLVGFKELSNLTALFNDSDCFCTMLKHATGSKPTCIINTLWIQQVGCLGRGHQSSRSGLACRGL